MGFLNKQLTFLLSLALLCSCEEGDRPNYSVEIVADDLQRALPVADIFTQVEKVPLDQGSGRPIGKVLKMVYLAGHFVILHQYTNYQQCYVSVYNRRGNHEYDLEPSSENLYSFHPLDIAVTGADEFTVLEGESNSLLSYSARGQLRKRRTLPFMAVNFTYEPKGNQYAFHKGYQARDQEDRRYFHNLLFTDSALQVQAAYFPFDIEIGSRTIVNFPFPLQQTEEGTIYFARIFTDSIYAFRQGEPVPGAAIHLGLPHAVARAWQQPGMPNPAQLQTLLEQGSFLLGGNYALSDRFLSFNLVTRESPAWGIWERQGDRFWLGRQGKAKDGTFFPSFLQYLPDVGFVSVLNEASLQYAPVDYLEDPTIDRLISEQTSYLLITQ